jgi:hypothetical protein
MKKLALDLDALSVDTFHTTEAPPAETGTVHGHVATGLACPVTSGINSCWCTEYRTCDCV